MIKKPSVSIIMNCLNGEEYLKDSLSSIVNQTYKNWELIFWDNRSTDKSADILKSFKDKRIRYFYAKKKTVLYRARNLAIKKARGKFIAFLDVDDFWEKNRHTGQDIIIRHPCMSLFFSFIKKPGLGFFFDGILIFFRISSSLHTFCSYRTSSCPQREFQCFFKRLYVCLY